MARIHQIIATSLKHAGRNHEASGVPQPEARPLEKEEKARLIERARAGDAGAFAKVIAEDPEQNPLYHRAIGGQAAAAFGCDNYYDVWLAYQDADQKRASLKPEGNDFGQDILAECIVTAYTAHRLAQIRLASMDICEEEVCPRVYRNQARIVKESCQMLLQCMKRFNEANELQRKHKRVLQNENCPTSNSPSPPVGERGPQETETGEGLNTEGSHRTAIMPINSAQPEPGENSPSPSGGGGVAAPADRLQSPTPNRPYPHEHQGRVGSPAIGPTRQRRRALGDRLCPTGIAGEDR